MLYRELAPITSEVWEEIDERASIVLKNFLSARRVFSVQGPKGFDYNVLSEGRLTNITQADGLSYGNYEVLPLTESRVEFDIERWELDNLLRGAKDIDYGPLEDAMKKMALFEENTIYNGLDNAMIKGLKNSVETDEIPFGYEPTEIMEAIAEGVIQLNNAYAQKPYTLIVGVDAYKRILAKEKGYPLDKRIQELIDGKIIISHVVDTAYLVPYNHDDLELTIGKDFSIGYVSHSSKSVKFFASESFTFRVLDNTIIVKYSL